MKLTIHTEEMYPKLCIQGACNRLESRQLQTPLDILKLPYYFSYFAATPRYHFWADVMIHFSSLNVFQQVTKNILAEPMINSSLITPPCTLMLCFLLFFWVMEVVWDRPSVCVPGYNGGVSFSLLDHETMKLGKKYC